MPPRGKAYAAAADLQVRFGDEISRFPADKVETALMDACAEMDAVLGAAFDLPIAGDFPLLKNLASTLARAYLFDKAPTERISSAAAEARMALRRLVEGDAALISAAGERAVRQRADVPDAPDARRFTDAALGGFV